MERKEQQKKLIQKLMREPSYVPMKEKELAVLLQVKKEDRDALKEALNELLGEGKIQLSKRGRYSLPEEQTAPIVGIYRASSRGYGFAEVEGEPEDYYIREENSLNAFHGDRVELRLTGSVSGPKKEAVVVKILERAQTKIVGTFEKAGNRYGFVIPDNPKIFRDIFIPLERSLNAADGQKVVCEILEYGSERRSPDGRIIELLGYLHEPGVDILSVIKSFALPVDFPDRAVKQAEKVPQTVSEGELSGRVDFRDTLMVTIDGEDAKDLDDAVSLRMEGENYILGVHIADVSHYVKEGSALDKEALKRGTSVYLVDRVLPMLPTPLSNGICSLNEAQDRLTLSCVMTIDPKGNIIDHEIVESVIRTNRRMTYQTVNEILKSAGDGDEAFTREYGPIVPMLHRMDELAQLLRAGRRRRGSIDFELPETKIELSERGRPVAVRPYERNSATKLIEDFMLAANETVAEHYFWLKLPFVYRVHGEPDPDKMRALQTFIRHFGYGLHLRGGEVHPGELQKLLAGIADTDEEGLISRLTLRSMQKAKYAPECSGHFGLACRYYCHFTSPIRRYPDLQIHRIIKEDLHGRLNEERQAHYAGLLPEVCYTSSSRERTADEAEREIEKMKKAEYMLTRIGRVYEGVISSVTAWGLYVELPNTVEGLLHVSRLNGFYLYDAARYELREERTGRRFQLGERIKVLVSHVDMMTRTVEFSPAENG